jgi:hypothetical protein
MTLNSNMRKRLVFLVNLPDLDDKKQFSSLPVFLLVFGPMKLPKIARALGKA